MSSHLVGQCGYTYTYTHTHIHTCTHTHIHTYTHTRKRNRNRNQAKPVAQSDAKFEDVNVHEFLESLSLYRAFTKPVRLDAAVEILNVLWEDEL